jgi:hypothetical protein
MKFFTRVLLLVLSIIPAFSAFSQTNWPQRNSLSLLQSAYNSSPSSFIQPTNKTVLTITSCGGALRTLDATSTPEIAPQSGSGLMNNDVWIGFKSVSTVVKFRVCDPTFDAAVEVYRLSDGAYMGNYNIAGDGGREYGLITNLTINENYAVRVGRVSGTEAGTFYFNVEYIAAALSPNYSPGPLDEPCYKRTSFIFRNNPGPAATNTRWKFVSPTNEFYCTSASSNMVITNCYDFCKGESYMVSCEIRATDAECGNAWWGYSLERPFEVCEQPCVNVVSPANNSTINIRSYNFQCAAIGNGAKVQWKFETDNGATVLCSYWRESVHFNPATHQVALANCLEFNKFYKVSVRVKYCDSETEEPEWCNHMTVYSSAIERIKLPPSECCVWKNKGSVVSATLNNNSHHNYRFRFTPVATTSNPCPANNLAPIGPAVVSGWITNYAVVTNFATLQPGTIYLVQVQGRLNSMECSNCSGSQHTLNVRYSDWGPPCLIGFRTNNGPAAGTPLSCGCNIGAMLAENWNEEEFSALLEHYGIIEEIVDEEILDNSELAEEEVVLSVYQVQPGLIQVDFGAHQALGQMELKIHDLNGKMVNSQVVYNTEEKQTAFVQLDANLPAGIYVMTLVSKDMIFTEKIFVSGQ